ncbi:MAG: hypothetical protein HN778_16885 [Prolixibacteraceae bacterium]|jgi:hypothetical protein|nr:hypothetical protein [Prolixibacteraceae bacterium]MBT6004944.1 hypothetical protein [Prolixibacteraceae bacterium]MBT6764798.1 hypothetical protein [Prolixibacteraceae bacterium]MBT6997723.1 hypothetical protein [Prolixibacteraceae bacterium]MBT7396505.1 hypothetical protein [Prolixibacteraceae bacterium]
MKDVLQKSLILINKYKKLFDQFGYLVDSNCQELAKNKIKRLQGAYKIRDSKMCNKIIDDLNQTIFRLSFKKQEDLSMFSNFGVLLFTWRKLSEPHLLNSTNYLKSVQHFNSLLKEMKNDTETVIVKLSSIYAELMETGTFVSGGIQCAKCGTINSPPEIYCENTNCSASWIESLNFDILQE